jgi:hypothetical protein
MPWGHHLHPSACLDHPTWEDRRPWGLQYLHTTHLCLPPGSTWREWRCAWGHTYTHLPVSHLDLPGEGPCPGAHTPPHTCLAAPPGFYLEESGGLA